MSPARRQRLRPLTVALYAALIGLLLASYVEPLQQILRSRQEIPALEQNIKRTEDENASRRQLVEDLQTREGIERAARERYGMIKRGETVYILPKEE